MELEIGIVSILTHLLLSLYYPVWQICTTKGLEFWGARKCFTFAYDELMQTIFVQQFIVTRILSTSSEFFIDALTFLLPSLSDVILGFGFGIPSYCGLGPKSNVVRLVCALSAFRYLVTYDGSSMELGFVRRAEALRR